METGSGREHGIHMYIIGLCCLLSADSADNDPFESLIKLFL